MDSSICLTSEYFNLVGKSYRIIDLADRVIISGTLTANPSIDVAYIAEGNYQVIIQDGDKKNLKRLTVQHH